MKKIFFFFFFTTILSCTTTNNDNDNDNDNQGRLEIDNRISITTWKLISIKNDAGKEIANDCELQNNKIILKYNPKSDDPSQRETVTLIEGKIINQGCQTITTKNINWMLFSQLHLYFPNNNTTYFYDYKPFNENKNTYMTITLTGFDDGFYHAVDERKTYRYMVEHKEFLD